MIRLEVRYKKDEQALFCIWESSRIYRFSRILRHMKLEFGAEAHVSVNRSSWLAVGLAGSMAKCNTTRYLKQ